VPYKLTKARTFDDPDLQEAVRWVEDELRAVEDAQAETQELDLREIFREPERPRNGMIVQADGTQWNPGQGRGAYVYLNGAWVKLSVGSDFNQTVTTVGDTNYTILTTDFIVVTNTAFTAARTWTLPAASAVPVNHRIWVIDRLGTITNTNTLVIQRAGSDTILDGLTSLTLNTKRTGYEFVSDGISKWTAALSITGVTDLLDRLVPAEGQIAIRGASTWGLAGGSGATALSKGFNTVSFDLGTVSSGTITPEPYNGAAQKLTNNGAFTWAAPTTQGEFRVLVTNAGSAGAVTFSGFTKKLGSGVFTTTNGHKFIVTVGRIESDEFYSIDPLQ